MQGLLRYWLNYWDRELQPSTAVSGQWSVASGLHHARLQPMVLSKPDPARSSVVLCLTASGEQGGEVCRPHQPCLANYKTCEKSKNCEKGLNAVVVLGP